VASSIETVRLRRDVESKSSTSTGGLKDVSTSNDTVLQTKVTPTTKKPTFSKQADESDFEIIDTPDEHSSTQKNNKQSSTVISDNSDSYSEPDYYEATDFGGSTEETLGILNLGDDNQSNKV